MWAFEPEMRVCLVRNGPLGLAEHIPGNDKTSLPTQGPRLNDSATAFIAKDVCGTVLMSGAPVGCRVLATFFAATVALASSGALAQLPPQGSPIPRILP